MRSLVSWVNSDRLGLQWDWPKGIESALILTRRDGYPTGPEDDRAKRFNCTKTEYEQQHGFHITPPKSEYLFITVYATALDSGVPIHSAAQRKDCRKKVSLNARRILLYSVSGKRRLFSRSTGTNGHGQLILTNNAGGNLLLPDLVLVGRIGSRPVYPTDGISILEIPDGTLLGAKGSVSFSLDRVNSNMKYRLFAQNESVYDSIEIKSTHSSL